MDIQSFRQFMGRTRNDLWYLTAPERGVEHLECFESLLHSLLLIPIMYKQGYVEKYGVLIMFSQEHWEVSNGHWNSFSYTGQFGIESILLWSNRGESQEDLLKRAKALVFQYMRPTTYSIQDETWKQERWVTGGLYKTPKTIVVGKFKSSQPDGLAS